MVTVIDGSFNSFSLDLVVEFLKKEKVVGLDIETSRKFKKGTYPETIYKPGLDPRVSRIVMLQVGNLEQRFVIDTRRVDITPILPFFESDILWVGANLGFEYKHILHNYKVRLNKIWDVMIAEICLYNGFKRSYSLKAIADNYLDVFDEEKLDLFNLDVYNEKLVWKEADTYLINKATARQFIEIGDRPFTISQINYGADDIELPLKIYNKQRHGRYVDGAVYKPTALFELEMETTLALAETEYNGIPFRSDKWMEVAKESEVKMIQLKQALDSYVENNHQEFCVASFDLFSSQPKCGIKWASSKQVIPLFKKLGVLAQEKRKTGKITDSVGEKALVTLLDMKHRRDLEDHVEYPIESPQDMVVQYLHYKHYEQLVKTFGKAYLKYVHPITHRLHTSFYQIVSTGRMSSNRPNVQQLPADKRFRDCFETVNRIVGADYAALEVRVMADISQVVDMQNFFITEDPVFGDDFHSYTASLVERLRTGDQSIVVTKKSHPEARQRAKITNFQVAYGASAVALSASFGCSVEEAQEFLDNYFDAWVGMTEYRKSVQRKAYELGYIEIDKLGRRWFHEGHQKMLDAFAEYAALLPKKKLSPEERALVRDQIYAERPDIRAKVKEAAKRKGSLERKALNYPIQGTSGSMLKLALVKTYRTLRSLSLLEKVKLVNAVHDEILIESHADQAEFASALLQTSMQTAGSELCNHVPFVADAYIDVRWKK